MPSVYGALAWAFWWTMYELRLIRWDPTPSMATFTYFAVLACYVVSAVVFYNSYEAWYQRKDGDASIVNAEHSTGRSPALYLAALHAVGFLGFILYARALGAALGGLPTFGQAFLVASWVIRLQGETTTSIGTQLSYFGWIAIALTWFEYRRGRITRAWLVIAVLQLFTNLFYIDRTRPVWILFVTALLAFVAVPSGRMKYLMLRVATLGLVFGGVFLAIAAWIGKVTVEGQYGASPLPLWAQNLYYYGTSGFAYFSNLIGAQETIPYVPERAIYPLLKALAALNVVAPPPSQINDFLFAPYPTNVGTFLEPFYHDGGIAFALTIALVHSFGLDLLGLTFLRGSRPLSLFAWANICFVTFIGFFVPKITLFPVWLFIGLGVAAILWHEGARAGPPKTAGAPVNRGGRSAG